LKEGYLELVTTFVNTQEANTTINNGPNGNLYLKSAGAEEIRTPDPLIAKLGHDHHRPSSTRTRNHGVSLRFA
jgi:hypothetical protein